MLMSPRQQQNSSRSNHQHHQKTQSMGDVSGIIKNIIANQTATQMPNIAAASPRNNAMNVSGTGAPPQSTGVSIERINKNISDSINNKPGHNKEIQLIQAYQHQKWKEQIT